MSRSPLMRLPALLLIGAAAGLTAALPVAAETSCWRAVVSARQFGAGTSDGGNQLLGAQDRGGRLVRITLADGLVIRGVQSSSDTTFWGNFSVGRSVEVCRLASRVVPPASTAKPAAAVGTASVSPGKPAANPGHPAVTTGKPAAVRRVSVYRIMDRTTGASLTGVAEASAPPPAGTTPRPLDRP